MSSIVNSTVANTYFTTAGAAVAATTQPTLDRGRISNLRDASIVDVKFNGNAPGDPRPLTNDGGSVTRRDAGGDLVEFAVNSGTGNFAYEDADGNYIVYGRTTSINGAANNLIRNPAAWHPNRQTLNDTTGTTIVATERAIRSGFWHEVSGIFTTAPTVFTTPWGADDAAYNNPTEPVEVAYRDGSSLPITGALGLRTSN